MNVLVLMAVMISATTLLDHTPVTATQDIDLLLMEENVICNAPLLFARVGSPLSPGDDIDECSEMPQNCDQVCTNTEGSFTCGCEAEYVLDSDGTSCSGKM